MFPAARNQESVVLQPVPVAGHYGELGLGTSISLLRLVSAMNIARVLRPIWASNARKARIAADGVRWSTKMKPAPRFVRYSPF